jgi:hypothetical protein
MTHAFWAQFSQSMSNITLVIFLINVVLHLIFAAGIAKDINNLIRLHVRPHFVPGFAWVLATLVGGVFVAAIYWVMHHSTLARRATTD